MPFRLKHPSRVSARCLLSAAALIWLAQPHAAWADGPEIVKDLGPAKGEWELDYVGQFGEVDRADDVRRHSGQSFYGLSDAVAIGGETLLGYRRRSTGDPRLFLDYDSVVAILRFSDPVRDYLGAGVWVQAALDEDGEVARLELRGILDRRGPVWRMQANLAVRRVNEERVEGTHLAYAAQLSRAVAGRLWLGVEASGQAGRLSGFARERDGFGQYLGPRVESEFGLGGRVRSRLALSYLRRLDAGGSRNTLQLTTGIRF